MQGTVGDFIYRDVSFRWSLSPNRMIYRVHLGSDFVGSLPTVVVRREHPPTGDTSSFYSLCDAWLDIEPLAIPPEPEPFVPFKVDVDGQTYKVVEVDGDTIVLDRPVEAPNPKPRTRRTYAFGDPKKS